MLKLQTLIQKHQVIQCVRIKKKNSQLNIGIHKK